MLETEARINQEELVKNRRKIWSIPIAVLALVLMLAGTLAVTGMVQAGAHSLTLTGPDGKEVPIVATAEDLDGDGTPGELHAEYTFAYDAPTTSYTGTFTLTGPSNRTISVPSDTESGPDDPAGNQFELGTPLSPTNLEEDIAVTHALTTAVDGDNQEVSVLIRLRLENAPPEVTTAILDQVDRSPLGTGDPADITPTTHFTDANNNPMVYTVLTHNV